MKREMLEVECWFLIPFVRDSDRGLHQPVLWRLLEEALSDAWGGWTGPETMQWGRKKGGVAGGWKPEGSADPIIDKSRKYTVFVPPGKLDVLRSLLKKAANSFDQQLERSWTARTDNSDAGRRFPRMTLVYQVASG